MRDWRSGKTSHFGFHFEEMNYLCRQVLKVVAITLLACSLDFFGPISCLAIRSHSISLSCNLTWRVILYYKVKGFLISFFDKNIVLTQIFWTFCFSNIRMDSGKFLDFSISFAYTWGNLSFCDLFNGGCGCSILTPVNYFRRLLLK